MKKYLVLALAASLMATPWSVLAKEVKTTDTAKSSQSCDKFADTMTSHVVNIFHDKKQSEEEKKQSLSILFQEAVDTDWIGKFVLGRYWKTASAEEKVEYLKNYRNYLTMVYISKFNDEAGLAVDAIKIVDIKPAAQPNQFEANTVIQRNGQPDVRVAYALEQLPTKCQVHDIKVEGVSLLTSHRSEFAALAGKSGVKGVIDAMKKQLEK